MPSGGSIRYKTDFDKFVVAANFERRGWERCDDEETWDIYWASVGTVKQIFGVESGTRLQAGQLVSHYPNHYELTRKDLMVKNIKRYQKAAKRDIGPASLEDLDIIPATFVLPQDYALFAEEYRRNPHSTWIMKPSSKSQGKGIFLINKLSQIKKWSSASALPPALRNSSESYVVSRYVDNPLLIGGKKFDLRLYVVVTSYKPLQVYMSKLGFGRFCNVKYSYEEDELDNEYVHLTNVAIQKHGSDYNEQHGNKWPLDNIRMYLEATRGIEATDRLFKDMEGVVIKSLRACQNIMINDKHCFELYGYDLLIDDTLKPWLIEVNASPSLTTTTQADRLLKFKVINDVLNVVTPLNWLAVTDDTAAIPAELRSPEAVIGPRQRVGSFHLIHDEAAEAEAGRGVRRSSSLAAGPGDVGARRSVSAARPARPQSGTHHQHHHSAAAGGGGSLSSASGGAFAGGGSFLADTATSATPPPAVALHSSTAWAPPQGAYAHGQAHAAGGRAGGGLPAGPSSSRGRGGQSEVEVGGSFTFPVFNTAPAAGASAAGGAGAGGGFGAGSSSSGVATSSVSLAGLGAAAAAARRQQQL